MNINKIKTMLNTEILNRMNDSSAARVLKNILFNSSNSINWTEAYELMMVFMPELKTYDGYKEEQIMTLLTVIETLQEVFEIYGDLEIKGIKDGELFDKVKLNCFDDDPTLYIELYHK